MKLVIDHGHVEKNCEKIFVFPPPTRLRMFGCGVFASVLQLSQICGNVLCLF